MSKIIKYEKLHESKLISLLKKEPDWNSFTSNEMVEKFKRELLKSETYICITNGKISGYIRALVDSFGIYVSELYVAPEHRNKGNGRSLLYQVREKFPDQETYVLSDEDDYYEKLGLTRIGSVFKL